MRISIDETKIDIRLHDTFVVIEWLRENGSTDAAILLPLRGYEALVAAIRATQCPEPDPVPCERCSNPIDPRGAGYCDTCLEDLADASAWLAKHHHCDICDSPTQPLKAAEIVVTCQCCLAAEEARLDDLLANGIIGVLNRVD